MKVLKKDFAAKALQRLNTYKSATFEQQTLLNGAFRKVGLEIERVRSMIHEQEGFWIFKKHVHSRDSLRNEIHHGKIVRILDNANNLAILWSKRGVLTHDNQNFFMLKCEEVYQKLEQLYTEVEKRDPTWWESVSETFRGFIEYVKARTPQFAIGFLMGVANFYPALQPLVSLFLPSPSPDDIKLLEAARADYIDIDVTVYPDN
jgi:hypothetical protein